VSTIERSIEVGVPARTAYNQWTQFEDFPIFMSGVESVTQLDDKHLHWRAQIGGVTEEWDAEITEQIPDKRIAWTSRSGAPNAGVVTFHRLADDRTKIMVQFDYEPRGVVESVGDFLGVAGRKVEKDLERFKEHIEKRGAESGAWRGRISNPDEKPGH
jgi:uncharacterized membrane protein